MAADLGPLFTRTPSPTINTATTPAATSTSTATPASLTFADKIVENRDARVITNQVGDILLLWTFLDHGTILITTNDATLREIVSRASSAPVQVQP